MKKTYRLLRIILLAGALSLVSAQTWRDDGYENVRWGASIEDVRRAYNNLQEIRSGNTPANVRHFQQKKPNREITTRTFSFHRDELYKVAVIYSNDRHYQKYKSAIIPDENRRRLTVMGDFYSKEITYLWKSDYRSFHGDITRNSEGLSDLIMTIYRNHSFQGIDIGKVKQSFFGAVREWENKNTGISLYEFRFKEPSERIYNGRTEISERGKLQFGFYQNNLYRIKIFCSDGENFVRELSEPFFRFYNRLGISRFDNVQGLEEAFFRFDQNRGLVKPLFRIIGNLKIEPRILGTGAIPIHLIYSDTTVSKQMLRTLATQGITYPELGYERVEWGTGIQETKNHYQNLTETSRADSAFGVRTFVQPGTDGGIVSRTFSFYQNSLYRVDVRYNEIVTELLKEKFTSIYGDDILKNLSFEIQGFFEVENRALTRAVATVGAATAERNYREERRRHGHVERPEERIQSNLEEFDMFINTIGNLAEATKSYTVVSYKDANALDIGSRIQQQKYVLERGRAEEERRRRLQNLGR